MNSISQIQNNMVTKAEVDSIKRGVSDANMAVGSFEVTKYEMEARFAEIE